MPSEPRAVWGDLAASAFVQASPLFRGLDEEALQDLLQVAEQISYQPGEVVLRQGEPGEEMFMVLDGNAVVRVAGGGDDQTLAHYDRGAVFGEIAALGGPSRTATVEARTELSVLRFPGPVITALSERFPKLGKLLAALAAARRRGG
jgi:CRP-like cAMP-binding protein